MIYKVLLIILLTIYGINNAPDCRFHFLRLPTDIFLGHLDLLEMDARPAETDSYPWLHGTVLASQGGHFSRN